MALVAIAVLALVFVPLLPSGALRESGPLGLSGKAAPVFLLRDDRGSEVSLSQYHGKIVVLNLWASWCPPCRAEMPDLQRLSAAYASRGVIVIGANQGESAQRARAFAASLRIGFPIWLDEEQRYGRALTAAGLPTTVIIARNGTIVRGFDGALGYGEMREAIAAALRS